jgi:biotin carboxyl carrier protein
MKYEIVINGARRRIEFAVPANSAARSPVTFTVDGRQVEADTIRISRGVYSILLGGKSLEMTVEESANKLLVRTKNREFQVEIVDPRLWRRGRGAGVELEGRQQLTAPMPGKIVRLLVTAGQQVEAGQGLLVIEAMKMQNEMRSPKSGTVEKLATEGQTVNAGEVLAIVS